MNRLKNFLKNEYVFSVVSKIITLVISLLTSILIARYLGAALKGSNEYISAVAGFGSTVATFGMHQAYPYYRNKLGKDNLLDDYMTIMVCIHFLYAVVAVIFSSCFIRSLELKIAVLIVPLQSFSTIVSYVTLIEWPNTRNAKHISIVLIRFLLVVILTVFTRSNFFWSVFIIVFLDIVQIVVYVRLIRFRFHAKMSQLRLVKQLIFFGFIPMIALLMTSLNYKVDIVMLRGFKSIITPAQIGVYSVGMNVADHIALIPDTLKWVLVSKLSKGKEEDEVAKVCRISFIANIFVCLGLLVVGKQLIFFLYGSEYSSGYVVLLICSFGEIFVGYYQLIAQYNIIKKKQVRNVLVLSLAVVINIILNLILIPRYQLAGAAFASGVGYFVSGILFLIWFTKTNAVRFSAMFLPQKTDVELVKTLFVRK